MPAEVIQFRKGDLVVKVIQMPGGLRTATIGRVYALKNGFVFTDRECRAVDGVRTFRQDNGEAAVNWIPGCRTYLVPLDADEERVINADLVDGSGKVKGHALRKR